MKEPVVVKRPVASPLRKIYETQDFKKQARAEDILANDCLQREFLITHETVNQIRDLLSDSNYTLSLDCDGSNDIRVTLLRV